LGGKLTVEDRKPFLELLLKLNTLCVPRAQAAGNERKSTSSRRLAKKPLATAAKADRGYFKKKPED
jgi:hypothetical protein